MNGARQVPHGPMTRQTTIAPALRHATAFRCRRLAAMLFMLAIGAALLPRPAPAQPTLVAYPARGQDERQQELDRFRCHEGAVKASHYNPRTAHLYVDSVYGTRPTLPPEQGGYFGRSPDPGVDTAGGAALGAVGGALTGDVGWGAGGGAVAGTLFGVIRRAGRERESTRYAQSVRAEQDRREADVAARARHYRHSWSVCMTELGYSVP